MNLIPQYIAEKIEQNQFAGQFSGFVLTIDISGSVELCERLKLFGKGGIEELTKIINSIFHPVIDSIYNAGGFVAHFAGDAIMGIFPADESKMPIILNCLQKSMEIINNSSRYSSKYGDFNIQAKAGVSFGEIAFKIPEFGADAKTFFFSGAAVLQSIYNQSQAIKNEVLIDETFKVLIDANSNLTYLKKEQLFVLNLNGFKVIAPKVNLYDRSISTVTQKRFIDRELFKKIQRGEFKSVASVFVSLVDNSDECLQTVLDLAAEFRAYLNSIESIADGLICLVQFGAPLATEIYLLQAIHFAMAVKQKLAGKVKVAITEGKVFSGFIGNETRSTYTNIGSTVNLAARIVNKSDWGKILVSESVYIQTTTAFSFSQKLDFNLKGLNEPQCVYELAPVQDTNAEIKENTLFGREENFDKIKAFTTSLFNDNKSGIYQIWGAPGIGKTAFIQEFCLKNQPLNIFRYNCSPIFSKDNSFLKALVMHLLSAESTDISTLGKESFDLLFRRFKDQAKEMKIPREQIEKLTRVKPLIGNLLGVPEYLKFLDLLPFAEKAVSVIMAVRDILETVTFNKNLTVIIDNAQWMDENSRKIFKIIAKSNPDNSLLFILLARDNDNFPLIQLPEDSRFILESTVFYGLNDTSAHLMIEKLLKTKISKAQRVKIFQLSEGNPFYITQFCEMLSRGSLKNSFSDIPPGIDNLLAARLDSLPGNLAALIKIAAVLGFEFDPEIVYAICTQNGTSALSIRATFANTLQQGELEKIWTKNSESLYTFDQILFQEAAYQRQLSSDLKATHSAAAILFDHDTPVSSFALARTAYHYFKAEKTERALNLYLSAGEAASSEYIPHFALKNYLMAENAATAVTGYPDEKLAEILFNTGKVYQNALAEYHTAEKTYQRALSLIENGKVESKVLCSDLLNHLGMVQQYSANFDAALQFYNSAYAMRSEYHGKEDAETVKILNNIGIIYWHKSDFENALKCFTEVISLLYDDSKEKNSLLIASASLNIANLYYKTKPDQAKKYYLRTIEIYKKNLPPDHHNIAAVANNLGELHKSLGEFTTALDYHQQAYAIRKKIFGNEHPLTAASISNLSEIQRLLGNYEKALTLQKQAATIKEKVFGFEHPSVAASYNNLGQIYKILNKNEIALKYFNRTYQIWLKTLGPNHHNLSMVIYNLADLSRIRGDHAQALDYYNRCIDIMKFNYPKGHPNQINILLNMSEVQMDLAKYDLAFELLNQALSLAEQFSLKEHPLYATIMHNLSTLYKKQNKLAEALSAAEFSRSVMEKKLGYEHPETALIYANLGDIHRMLTDYSTGLIYYNKALKVFSVHFKDTALAAETYIGLGLLLNLQNKPEESRQVFVTALEIIKILKKTNKSPDLKIWIAQLKEYGVE